MNLTGIVTKISYPIAVFLLWMRMVFFRWNQLDARQRTQSFTHDREGSLMGLGWNCFQNGGGPGVEDEECVTEGNTPTKKSHIYLLQLMLNMTQLLIKILLTFKIIRSWNCVLMKQLLLNIGEWRLFENNLIIKPLC